jgi:hypothetical protein
MALVLQWIETIAIVVGVVFGLIQLRQLRLQHEVQGGAELLRSLQSPQTIRAALLVQELPDDLTTAELKSRLGADYDDVTALMAMFESIGPLVARGHVPIDMYADFYSGGTVLCWRKLKRSVEERRASGWSNFLEWFQWLAERMDERAPLASGAPAFEAHRNWTAPSDYFRQRR